MFINLPTANPPYPPLTKWGKPSPQSVSPLWKRGAGGDLNLRLASRPNQRGTTLIELIMFIVIVGAALAGILQVMNLTTGHSADAMLRKQSLAIAESLLEEIELMPFTYCDPNDANAASAGSTAGCASMSQDVITGPTPSTSTRGSLTNPFNNVADYSNYQMTGITDVTGAAIAGLSGYKASVNIARAGTALLGGGADNGAALLSP